MSVLMFFLHTLNARQFIFSFATKQNKKENDEMKHTFKTKWECEKDLNLYYTV